jgi:thymidylate synthase
MRYFTGPTADTVWQTAAMELLVRPDFTHKGRNGETREIIPCVLQIHDPRQRWILSRYPPYNPAFGLVEFIWIVTGNRESIVPNYWNPGLSRYSGTGIDYHGAYGFRLRHEFGFDQIRRAYDVLTSAPETRQAVLQIWKPDIDMPASNGRPAAQDIPCNVMSLLKVRDGRLHWTQIMRSNDVMRGLPYNIIQFTMLQELMASWLGCSLGDYFHLSDSLHIYERDTQAFSIRPAVARGIDRPAFSLSYDATADLLCSLYDDLRHVAASEQTERSLMDTFHPDRGRNGPRCALVKDIMAVIGSDAARRHGYQALARTLAESCLDTDLRCAAISWIDHTEPVDDDA